MGVRLRRVRTPLECVGFVDMIDDGGFERVRSSLCKGIVEFP